MIRYIKDIDFINLYIENKSSLLYTVGFNHRQLKLTIGDTEWFHQKIIWHPFPKVKLNFLNYYTCMPLPGV